MNPLLYRKYLKLYCKNRAISLLDLSTSLGLIKTYYSIFGVTRGISFEQLEKAIKYLDLSEEEANILRKNVNYSSPRNNEITIDDEFVKIVIDNTEGHQERSFAAAIIVQTLRFVGIKSKIK
jgi:hypothetical protein